jgi:hypothetical protein
LHLIGYIAHITKFPKDPTIDPAEKEAKGNLSKKEANGAVPHNPIYCWWWSHARNSQKAMHVRMVVVLIPHPYAAADPPNKTRGRKDGRRILHVVFFFFKFPFKDLIGLHPAP